MPKVSQGADAHLVDLDQVHRVAPVPGAFLRVVIGGKADHADAGHLILARTADLICLAHSLDVIVVVMLVAYGDEVGVQSLQLEPDRGRVGICDDGGVAAAQPEAAVSEPANVQISSYLIKSEPDRLPRSGERDRRAGLN